MTVAAAIVARARRPCSGAPVTAVSPAPIYLLGAGLDDDDSWRAAGITVTGSERTLDLKVVHGTLDDVQGRSVAVSGVVADKGDLSVGEVMPARLADTSPASLQCLGRRAAARPRSAAPRATRKCPLGAVRIAR